ncbi:MAG: DUF559 domain-containing protein [Lacisediminihabitans sp.]
MASPYYDTWRRGGVAATHELLCDGHTSHQLTAAVRAGTIIRVRQGHYACPAVSIPEIEAFRVGGRLTGLSGARHHGIWTPPNTQLDVTVRPDARALRSRSDKTVRLTAVKPTGVAVRWTDTGDSGTRTAVNAVACLRDIVRKQSPIVAFAAVESALFQGMISETGWKRELEFLTPHYRGALNRAGKLSESGGESMMKYHLILHSIAFAQQVKIAGVGRIDFLLGRRLVVEVDGAEFHTSRASFEEDRRRDAVLGALGYQVLRFSYTQVAHNWKQVEAAIFAALARANS